MIDEKIISELREVGRRVKALLPKVNANVQINIGKAQDEPVVNVNLADVTKVKK